MRIRGVAAAVAVLATGMVTGAAGTATGAAVVTARTRVSEGICSAPPARRALAAQLSADIGAALRGRPGGHAVTVYDTVTKVSCHVGGARHFTAASIVKTIILAALLRWRQEDGQPLSAWERDEAAEMITQSDNDAATALWNEVGITRLQRFLSLAKMSRTRLGPGDYWGLSQVTAHDEMLLLQLLSAANPVLAPAARSYELGLMARVIPAQRWGAPAGAPGSVTVHVKNGWLPEPVGWHVNSLGVFTGKGKNYLIAVLTDGNLTEQHGIGTIEGVARMVHRDLNAAGPSPGARLAANVGSTPAAPPRQASPWAVVPALPTPRQRH